MRLDIRFYYTTSWRFFLQCLILLISALFLAVLPIAYLELYSELSSPVTRLIPTYGSGPPAFIGNVSRFPIITYPGVVSDVAKSPELLGIASFITIISLPSRTDRRRDMETLLKLLSVPDSGWRYFDAVKSTDERVQAVMDWVRLVRTTNVKSPGNPGENFFWPDRVEMDKLVESDVFLDIWHTDPWPSPFGSGSVSESESGSGISAFSPPPHKSDLPLMLSATQDFNFLAHSSQQAIPNHRLLTHARLACWFSHLEVIHQIANGPIRHGETAIVLEDDVDMEFDIKEQLRLVWSSLPKEWDVVFLGHCWSNESYHPSLISTSSDTIYTLHPAHKPKCTHAYALTRTGARRLLLHLRYPPFAFSRAIDQALAWLVESGKLQGAFSVVPSLVVQRKVRGSDVFPGGKGKGSRWREGLRKGVLSSILSDPGV